jgi:hypothetical protein
VSRVFPRVSSPTSNRRAFASLCVISVLALGSCAKSPERVVEIEQTPAAVLQATAALTEAAGTYKTAGEMVQFTGPDSGLNFSLPISGAVDTKGNRTEVSIDIGPMLKSLGGLDLTVGEAPDESDVSVSDSESDVSGSDSDPLPVVVSPSNAARNAPNTTYEFRLMNGTLYVTLGALGDSVDLPDGKWVKLDAKALGLSEAELVDLTGGGASPELGLQYLASVNAGDVVVEGTEQVRGENTTRYTATVNLEALAQRGSPAMVKRQKKNLEELGAAKTVPMTVWIDGEGRTRKMKYELAITSSSIASKSTITMEFYDFGLPVEINAPDPSNTLSLDEVPKYKEAIEAQTKG